MSPLRPPVVFRLRIAWNVAPLLVPVLAPVRPGTSLHSMISSLPLTDQSTALSVLPAAVPVAFVVQSSHAGAIAACVGELVRSVLENAVDVEPNVMRPFALAEIAV